MFKKRTGSCFVLWGGSWVSPYPRGGMWLCQETNETRHLSVPFWALVVFSLSVSFLLFLSLSVCLPSSLLPSLCLSGLHDGRFKQSFLSGSAVLELRPLEKDLGSPQMHNPGSGCVCGRCPWPASWLWGRDAACSKKNMSLSSHSLWITAHTRVIPGLLGKFNQIKNVHLPYRAVFLLFIYLFFAKHLTH